MPRRRLYETISSLRRESLREIPKTVRGRAEISAPEADSAYGFQQYGSFPMLSRRPQSGIFYSAARHGLGADAVRNHIIPSKNSIALLSGVRATTAFFQALV